jgi:hypothetical protein
MATDIFSRLLVDISHKLLEGKDTAVPEPTEFDPAKFPYGSIAGYNKRNSKNCPLCGKPPTSKDDKEFFLFRDFNSAEEYRISGLCQECQDYVFAEPKE